jgi:hypothetical protein
MPPSHGQEIGSDCDHLDSRHPRMCLPYNRTCDEDVRDRWRRL